jgi:hypothetical protein
MPASVGSTAKADEVGDRAWRNILDSHHSVVRAALARFGGTEIDTAGDGFLATFDGPARAVRCGCDIRDNIRDLGLEIRAGLHTGEVERRPGSVTGVAVHVGARVAALAAASEVAFGVPSWPPPQPGPEPPGPGSGPARPVTGRGCPAGAAGTAGTSGGVSPVMPSPTMRPPPRRQVR